MLVIASLLTTNHESEQANCLGGRCFYSTRVGAPSSRFLCRGRELDHPPPVLRRRPLQALREIGRYVKLDYFCHGSVLHRRAFTSHTTLDSQITASDAAGCHLIVKRMFANVPLARVRDMLVLPRVHSHQQLSFAQKSLCQSGANNQPYSVGKCRHGNQTHKGGQSAAAIRPIREKVRASS